MLAIEIDGIIHGSEEARERDLTRQARLESLGVSFLRFYDGDVKENLEGVLAEIESWVLRYKGTSPFREADPLGGKSPFEGGLDLFPPLSRGVRGDVWMLAIEIDGFTHGSEEARERDLTRQARLESLGVSFLRFYDGDVKENLQGEFCDGRRQ